MKNIASGIGIGIGFFIGQPLAQILFAYIVTVLMNRGAVMGGQIAGLLQ